MTQNDLDIRYNHNIGKTTWFGVGGACETFFRPKNIQELQFFFTLDLINRNKITILGNTSNVIVPDEGVKGITIKLGRDFAFCNKVDEKTIKAGASCLDSTISQNAYNFSISGLEYLSGIPGSLGGAVFMNAGCFGGEISQNIKSIDIFDTTTLQIKKLKTDEINFQYRKSNLPQSYIILGAELEGRAGLESEILSKMNEIAQKRSDSQPLKTKTGGSTFKNPPNKSAWQLIRESGADKLKVGGAFVSQKHANFLINDGTAKSSDLILLINQITEQVFNKTGTKLELEIKILN